MDTKGRLVAVSHNRNEFVLINADEIERVNSVKELSGQICGDEIEFIKDDEPVVACNECAFPICRPCYEYERREGNQAYPQCQTRYKRIKGSPRVDGDEDEDEFDELDNEFDCDCNDRRDPMHFSDAALSDRFNIGSRVSAHSELEIPLLTYGQEDDTISFYRPCQTRPSYTVY